ncbi:hypothetical protein AAF712_012986 [Marasmius tenuissimus]|uniref:Uncharacterized protein n=1 Tax=Marasmius tenuissimus TaxID=585030 RepID=A0ABR2ZF27_9AGAR
MSGKSLAIDYLDLTRIRKFPRGCDLVFWPSAWGLLLAANNHEIDTRSLVIQHLWLAIGGGVLHAGVYVLNDILDGDFDGKVERTKDRPLVTGVILVRNAVLLWTISYDTMYAFQDVENDLQVGIKSTAISFGPKNVRKILTGFYAVFLLTLYIAGILNGQGFYYFFNLSRRSRLAIHLATHDVEEGQLRRLLVQISVQW